MKKDAVMQGTMAISYEERDVSTKVVLTFLRGNFLNTGVASPWSINPPKPKPNHTVPSVLSSQR